MPSCGRTPPVANEILGPVPIDAVFTASAALGAFILCVQVHEDRLRVEVEEEIENFKDPGAALVALTLRDDLAVLRFYVPVKLAVLFLPVLESDQFGFHERVRNEYAGLGACHAQNRRRGSL